MAEDFDVEALLDAPFSQQVSHNRMTSDSDTVSLGQKRAERPDSGGRESARRSSSRTRDEDKKSRKRSRSRDRHRRSSRSRERKDRRIRKSRSRSRSRDRRKEKRSGSRERRHRSRSPRYRGARRRGRYDRSRSPRKEATVEDRDQRTVLCVQLAAAVRQRDLEEFFSSVGKVREVRLILDNKTRKHKGIAYIEFYDIHSVPLALALNGQRLCGRPIIIQPSMAEKNRAASSTAAAVQRGMPGPLRLYVGSLHFNITEDMLRGIFEPFGRIDRIELMRDPENSRSKGYGFISFFDPDDAKKALEQLNGFELAGRPMKVNYVTDRSDNNFQHYPSHLDSDETERSGIELGTTGRLQLMARLAEGTGIKLPQAAVAALQSGQVSVPAAGTAVSAPTAFSGSVATQTFLLTNMFDPKSETSESWHEDIRSDVLDECRKHGGAYHVFVDRMSDGNVYVKCPSVAVAAACVSALHGRWFSGRLVTAAYVPVTSYHSLFPESLTATTPL